MEQKRKVFPKTFKNLLPSMIRVCVNKADGSIGYQRATKNSQVSRIVKEFDENLVNVLKVSYRDGCYNCFDGGHTLSSWVDVKGEDTPIGCMVYEGMSYSDETYYFMKQNGISSTISYSDRYKARLSDGEKNAVKLHEFLESCEIVESVFRGSKSTKSANAISCIKEIETIYVMNGEAFAKRIINVIKEAFNDTVDDRFNKETINAVAYFYEVYKDKTIYDQYLAKALSTYGNSKNFKQTCEQSLFGTTKLKMARGLLKRYNASLTGKMKTKASLTDDFPDATK